MSKSSIVLYASRTNNTKKVAFEIFKALNPNARIFEIVSLGREQMEENDLEKSFFEDDGVLSGEILLCETTLNDLSLTRNEIRSKDSESNSYKLGSAKFMDLMDSSDNVILGFWLDKGRINTESFQLLEESKGKKLAIFGTLGAPTGGERIKAFMDKLLNDIAKKHELLGSFICQGSVDPVLHDIMKKRFGSDDKHKPKGVVNPDLMPTKEDLALAFKEAQVWLSKMW